MRKFLATFAALSAVITSNAQTTETGIGEREESVNPDRMSIRVAGYEVMLEARDSDSPTERRISQREIRKRRNYYGGRIGTFEVGFNGFREAGDAYALYPEGEKGFMDLRMGHSFHFTLNVWTFSTSLTRNHELGVTGAIGLTTNDYTFETPSAYVMDEGLLRPTDAGRSLKKAKLNTFAIHFPLALEINPTRNFFFSVGGYVDLVTGGHMKWKKPKETLREVSPNFLQAGVTARVGFKNAYLFGSYNFVEIFKDGRGPALNPYTFGMGFGF